MGAALKPGPQRKLENSGMFACEREIVDLSDSGMSAQEIAATIGKSLPYVRSIVSRFHVTGRNPFNDMTARGSAALLSAIVRHHPERMATMTSAPLGCTL